MRQNRWNKTHDNIEFIWKGKHKVGPRNIIKAKEGGPDSDKQDQKGKDTSERKSGRGRRMLEEEDKEKKDMVEEEVEEEEEEEEEETTSGGAREVAISRSDDRGRILAETDSCIPASVMLLEPFQTKGFGVEISIMVIPGVSVGGGVELGIESSLEMKGEACVAQRTVQLALIPVANLMLRIELFVEIAKIVRAGLSVEAILVGVALEPTLAITLKSGVAVRCVESNCRLPSAHDCTRLTK